MFEVNKKKIEELERFRVYYDMSLNLWSKILNKAIIVMLSKKLYFYIIILVLTNLR